MRNFYLYIFALISFLANAQTSLESEFYNIGNRGSGELKNLKLSQNSLFFTGKEFNKFNLGRYDFNTEKFITYNQEKENNLLGYENFNYITINKNVYFVYQDNNVNKGILFGSENGNIDILLENENIINMSKLIQFDNDYFFFIITEKIPETTNQKKSLWVSDGTKLGTKIITSSLNYSGLEIINKIKDELYYTFNGRTYTYNSKTGEIIDFFSYIGKPNFIFKDELYYFNNNYQENSYDLYVIKNQNYSEKIGSLKDDFISNEIKYYTIGDKVYIYTNSSDNFYANSYLYIFNSVEKTIKKVFETPFKGINNIFHYNEDFYFSIFDQNNKYLNYKIENDSIIEVDYNTEINYINSPIVFDNKIFFNGDNKIYYIDLITKEKNLVDDDNYNIGGFTSFYNPFVYNNELYFTSVDELNGQELFKYNKSSNTKNIVFNYNKTIGSLPFGFEKVNNNILFFANNSLLYKFNPVNKKHNLILDHNQNRIKGIFSDMVANFDNKKIIFSTDKFELGFSDGTEDGTFIFNSAETDENFLEFYTSNLVPINNKIIFEGKTKYQGSEPWVSDGTKEGTFILKDIMDGYESSIVNINENGLFNNKLYFIAISDSNTLNSNSIYETDGTRQNTKEIYTEDSRLSISVKGHYKNYLIIGKSLPASYNSEFFLLDPNTLEQITLEQNHTPYSFFEFEGKLYCSEYNSFYYYDENYKMKLIKNEQSINLIKIGVIDEIMYLYSDYNGFIYKLKNNILEIVDNEYLTKKQFRKINDFIYYINRPYINNQLKGNYLQIINKNGLKKYKLNFIDETNKNPYIEEYRIIDNTLYLSKNHELYGPELYTINLSESVLNNTEVNTTINISSNFDIYPNPSTDYFRIKSNSNKKFDVTIFNTIGQKLKTITAFSNENININGIPKGIYIIHIDNGINKENKKLIIK
jgi:ELWxxDGT repeat protein